MVYAKRNFPSDAFASSTYIGHGYQFDHRDARQFNSIVLNRPRRIRRTKNPLLAHDLAEGTSVVPLSTSKRIWPACFLPTGKSLLVQDLPLSLSACFRKQLGAQAAAGSNSGA
jgi:hypothetical protein